MAVRSSDKTYELLRSSMAPLVAAVCAVLALVPAAGLGWFLAAHPAQRAEMQAYMGGWIIVMCLVAAISVQLARGRAGAQRFLLVFWLLVAMVSLLSMLAGALWGLDWWTAPLALHVLAVPMLAISLIAVALLVACSTARSRLRYASYVTVSLAAAAGIVIVFNMIAQTEYYRRDIQTLGRYGLSQRTRRILQSIQAPVRLTCVYTSSDEKMRASDYRPAVLELLEEMQQANPRIEVANAATDSAKAKVVSRLRGQLGAQVEQHTKFLREFNQRTDPLRKAIATEGEMWKALGEDSYVGMWGLQGELVALLGKTSQELERSRSRVARELAASALPDFAGIIEEVIQAFTGDRDTLQARAAELEKIAKIPAAAQANKAAVLAAMDKCVQSVQAMTENSRATTQPADASDMLVKSIVSARKAIQDTLAAAKAMENIAGTANAELVRQSRRFQLTVPSGTLEVRTDLATFLEKYVAKSLEDIARELEGIKRVAKPEYYAQGIRQMNGTAREIRDVVTQVRQAATAAVEALCTIDDASKKILQRAGEKEAFKEILGVIRPLVEDAQKLPALENNTLTKDIVSDNIIIVETGGKAGVVKFDEVWPLKSSGASASEGGGTKEQRVFNGDSAVASKVLVMTSEPFATLVLTYFLPVADAAAVLPPSEIVLEEVSALRKRLEESNFEVRLWNLSEALPVEGGTRPAVLLVLPPPPTVPLSTHAPATWKTFSAEHIAKVRQAIDSGIPAIFLAQFQPPRQVIPQAPPIQPPYGFGEYLAREWGLDVRNDYLVVPAVRDEVVPDRFKIDNQRFAYMPLSNFSDHDIARPLQAQRLLWTWLSPITRTGPVPGVTVWPLLTVPANWESTWATTRLKELISQFQTGEGSYIWPDYAAGDMRVPFDVAVAAVRGGQPTTRKTATSSATTTSAPAGKPARIVVMTTAASLVDGYLNQRVSQTDAKGTLTLTDPPWANADLVINSVYWLIGREQYIAAGPVQVKPVALISPNVLAWVRGLCLVGLPLVVAGIGGVVMLLRRR